MIPKFVISTTFLIMLLSFPTVSPAKFFDSLSEKIEKESKRTEKRMKQEIDRTDKNFDKITKESKEKAKSTWADHRDEIVPVIVAATVIYVGDVSLATLALKEYGIIKEDGTIEWGTDLLLQNTYWKILNQDYLKYLKASIPKKTNIELVNDVYQNKSLRK